MQVFTTIELNFGYFLHVILVREKSGQDPSLCFEVFDCVSPQYKAAYVSQQAWIQNATVRDNILFGSRYNKKRYERVVAACELTRDFEILDAGDQTEIGEKVSNASVLRPPTR